MVAASFLCSIHHAASFMRSTCLRSSANASRSSMRAWRASTSTWLRVRRRIGSARSHWDLEPHSSQNPSSPLRYRDAMPMQAGHDTRSAFLTRCSTTTYGPSTLIRSWCPHACVTNLQAMTYRLPGTKPNQYSNKCSIKVGTYAPHQPTRTLRPTRSTPRSSNMVVQFLVQIGGA